MAIGNTKKLLFGLVIGGTVITLIVFSHWHAIIHEEQYFLAHDLDMLNSSNGFIDENPGEIQLRRTVFKLGSSEEPPPLLGSENRTDKEKYFIYRCDDSLNPCGGFSDRIKGAMTAYMVANLTGRTYKLEMFVGSCDFHKFVVPNQVDWFLPKPFHTSVQSAVRSGEASFLDFVDRDLQANNEDGDFLALPGMGSKYIYFKGNRDSTRIFQASSRYKGQLSWMSRLRYSEMNEAIYKHLFKPSQYLRDKLARFFKQHLQPRDKLVCAHFRFARNPTLPADTPTRIKKKHLPNLWTFLDEEIKRQDNAKVFIMTDNGEIVTQVKRRQIDRIFVSPGPILHVDRYRRKLPPEMVCEGFEKVIFDQLILMHCDVLVVGRSGLSQMAAYVRGTDKGLYCFGPTGQVLPCKRNEIRMVFYGKKY